MLELDSLLGAFVDRGYAELPREDRDRFESLLSLPDPLLWAWFFGGGSPDDPDLARLVERIRTSNLASD